MSETCQVHLVLGLRHRVLQWDSLNRVEFIVFLDQLREYGLEVLDGNDLVCSVEETFYGPSGEPERIDFWLKIRGQWMFLSLEVRSQGVFVLHETKQGSGP